MTFEEYQKLAASVPPSLRNNRARIDIPVLGLQTEAGKIGSLLATAFASGGFALTQEQSAEIQGRLSEILWYVALLCTSTGIAMQDVAAYSAAQLQIRAKHIDSDERQIIIAKKPHATSRVSASVSKKIWDSVLTIATGERIQTGYCSAHDTPRLISGDVILV
jgi:hypothetical protein